MVGKLWTLLRPVLPWLGMVLLLALLVQAVNPANLLAALRHANLWLILPILGCGLVGLILRSIRWHLLLQSIDAPNSLLDSIILFSAAQAALLVPGGQFLLPVLQRSQYGTLIRRSAPTILVQELVYGLLVLPAALPGVPPYHPAGWLLLVAFIFNAGTAVALLQGGVLRRVVAIARHIPFIREHVGNLTEMQSHVVTVARSSWAVYGTLFDMAAIAIAGLGLLLALQAVGAFQIDWLESMAVYALGSAVGTLSALPGGIGATEDISTLVLHRMSVDSGAAAAGILLFRVVNLLMGTGVGWLVLTLARSRLRVHPTFAGIAKAVRGAEEKVLEGNDAVKQPEQYLKT
ncbi:MAG TPA: lysylphosphatidylglycerol synthase transmembrane domain-containing protein [Chloroflexota bacterium]